MKTWKTPATTVSEVLQRAFQVFGRYGKHWNNYTIRDGAKDTVCSLGAIGVAASGGNATSINGRLARRAITLVKKHAGTIDNIDNIPSWNDSQKSFTPIKNAFCGALKEALKKDI